MNILITGGAGYIGSHVIKQFLEYTSYNIYIIDNLSTGSKSTLQILKSFGEFTFIELDLKDFDEVKKLFEKNNFDIVLHFAASIVVPESIENPLKYYLNNTTNTINLINCAINTGVEKFIFSSTAAVYGNPINIDINGVDETYPTSPINPYGYSKLMSEQILQDVAMANSHFKFVIFRYFNVAGADIFYKNEQLSPRLGQSFPNATHLIKIASECATNQREKMYIFGNDYDTKDGTCIRDYIHVDDLAFAHIKAIDFLDYNDSDIFNLGYSKGYSVKEIIHTIKNISQVNFNVDITSRRLGDPAILFSNNAKFVNKFGNIFRYNDIKLICQSAYMWESVK